MRAKPNSSKRKFSLRLLIVELLLLALLLFRLLMLLNKKTVVRAKLPVRFQTNLSSSQQCLPAAPSLALSNSTVTMAPPPSLTSPPTENGRDESEGFKQRERQRVENSRRIVTRYIRQSHQKHKATCWHRVHINGNNITFHNLCNNDNNNYLQESYKGWWKEH